MPIKLKNNVSSTLATAISASDVGLVLASGTGALFPSLVAGDYFYATLVSAGGTQEVVRVTDVAGDSMTVVRGVDNTSAQSFAAGSRIEMRVNAAAIEEVSRRAVSAKDFGVIGDGVVNDSVAFQRFVTYCGTNLVQGICDCPVNLANAIITVSSNTSIEFIGDGRLLDGSLNATGSLGSEVGMTTPSLRGTVIVNAPGTTFAAGDLIYLKSCINCLSVDAGDDRLGFSTGFSYFAEFAVVRSVTGSAITVSAPLIFNYTNTAGANSGTRTNSTVAKVTPVENIRLSNIVMRDKASTLSWQIYVEYGRNVDISGAFSFSTTSGIQHCVGFATSLGCAVSRAAVVRQSQTAGSSGSSQNSFLTYGAQDCGFSNLDITGGGQAVDFTYLATNAAKAAPSINCFVQSSYFWGAREAVTVHPGCFSTSISNCNAYGCETSFRLRSKATRLVGFNSIRSYLDEDDLTGSGVGVLISEGGYSEGSIVSGGTCVGHLYGVAIDQGRVTASPVAGRLLVSDVVVADCTSGIAFYAQTATNAIRPVTLANITAINCRSTGISILSYNNGVVIDGYTALGPYGPTARAGIQYDSNLTNLTIKNATFINLGAVFGLRGPSTTSFITNTTIFPLGNAEANLCFSGFNYVGQNSGTEFTGIIRDQTAFSSGPSGYDYQYKIGTSKIRIHTSQTADVQEWQGSTGTKLLGVSVSGKLTGTVANSVKASITAASDVATLKTALLGLFE